MGLYKELEERGMIAQATDAEAIEKLLGVDLPDDIVEKIIDGVKAKMAVDSVADIAGKLKKLF